MGRPKGSKNKSRPANEKDRGPAAVDAIMAIIDSAAEDKLSETVQRINPAVNGAAPDRLAGESASSGKKRRSGPAGGQESHTGTGKRKKVNFSIIPEKDQKGKVNPVHAITRRLIASVPVHSYLAEARIALAWRRGWKPDNDGRLILGQARKAADIDRSLHDYDFVILLNEAVWAQFSDEQRTALLDHELSHCATATDKDGETQRDETGRIVYRVRKHDLEEFRGVVQRNGLYKSDLAEFARIALEAKKIPLFPGLLPDETVSFHPGPIGVPSEVTFTSADMPKIKEMAKVLRGKGIEVVHAPTDQPEQVVVPATLSASCDPDEWRFLMLREIPDIAKKTLAVLEAAEIVDLGDLAEFVEKKAGKISIGREAAVELTLAIQEYFDAWPGAKPDASLSLIHAVDEDILADEEGDNDHHITDEELMDEEDDLTEDWTPADDADEEIIGTDMDEDE